MPALPPGQLSKHPAKGYRLSCGWYMKNGKETPKVFWLGQDKARALRDAAKFKASTWVANFMGGWTKITNSKSAPLAVRLPFVSDDDDSNCVFNPRAATLRFRKLWSVGCDREHQSWHIPTDLQNIRKTSINASRSIQSSPRIGVEVHFWATREC